MANSGNGTREKAGAKCRIVKPRRSEHSPPLLWTLLNDAVPRPLLFQPDESPVQATVVRAPRREARSLAVKLISEVDICLTVEEVAQIQPRPFQMMDGRRRRKISLRDGEKQIGY